MRLLISPLDRGYHTSYDPYGCSHTGLQVSSLNIAKVLSKDAGLDVLTYPVKTPEDLEALIMRFSPTHVVLSAFWLPTDALITLTGLYPNITFAVNCHSNVAFLQSEADAITAIRNLIDLEQSSQNFVVSGNSREFQTAIERSYDAPCTYLPNLYYLDKQDRSYRPRYNGGTLRIGCFGALRPLKNPTVAGMAALQIARDVGTDLKFYINVGRTDGWGDRILEAIRAEFAGLPDAELVEVPWQGWAPHCRITGAMHLLLQPSYSETFNITTADGVTRGVPSVVGHAIEWAPDTWKANPESSTQVAWTGRSLLYDAHAGRDGIAALRKNNITGIDAWKEFLGVV